jgi:two-component system cell cycle sensor histidine kinase/response regulator CckA
VNDLERLRRKTEDLEGKCRQLEKALRESEERFHKIFHASSNMIAISTIKEGKMIDLNEASADLGGFKREELIGSISAEQKLWADPKQRDFVARKIQKEGRVANLPVDLLAKDGNIRRVLFSADPITLNNEPCLLSVCVDITQQKKEADALRQSEEKYRLLVENSLQGLAIIQDQRFVFCNSAFADSTGYSVEELMSLPDTKSIIHPEDRERVVARHHERLSGKPVARRYEYRLLRKDGSVCWLDVLASQIVYNGKPAAQIVHMDITERKEAENSLRESEERFRLIAETIDEIFWIFDAEKQVLTYLSPAFERIWGYPREQFLDIRKPSLNPIHPDDRKRVISENQRIEAGHKVDIEYRVIRPDGSIRHIWHRGYPVIEKTGEAKRSIGVGQDITAFIEAEEALRESREYYNQIINRISDPIFVKDRDHRFVLVNDALCAFVGKRREELLGKNLFESMPRELAVSLSKQEDGVFKTGHENISEDILSDLHGDLHNIMAKKSLFVQKSGNKQIIGVLRDITEYKRLESQLLQAQKMEAIGALAGGVAHDFNNLLNVINGYSELLLDAFSEEDPGHADLEQIKEAGQRAAALTSQLLAFSRKQILQPEILDLNEVVENISTMLRRLIREDIELVLIPQPGLGMVHADPGQIQQVVMNLSVNARDAMPQGGKLTIETANVVFDKDYVVKHPAAKVGSYVMLAVSDNGAGMSEETQAHLFEPFFTTKERGKGTGLGLSTVYGIVKQSGGFIWVYSEPGKGTTFKVYLPRIDGSNDQPRTEDKAAISFQGSETVLIIEDEAAVRLLASRILRNHGYTVLEASDGTEALHISREYKDKIHLIITDVVMPGMSGTALVSRIQDERPDIRALYMSGYTDNAIVHHGMLDSDVAFLQKPFTVGGLARKVRDVLNL